MVQSSYRKLPSYTYGLKLITKKISEIKNSYLLRQILCAHNLITYVSYNIILRRKSMRFQSEIRTRKEVDGRMSLQVVVTASNPSLLLLFFSFSKCVSYLLGYYYYWIKPEAIFTIILTVIFCFPSNNSASPPR